MRTHALKSAISRAQPIFYNGAEKCIAGATDFHANTVAPFFRPSTTHWQSSAPDILVTHEAPSCHPQGFKAIDDLARAMRVQKAYHGHHHDRIDYSREWGSLGFQAIGVEFCGVTDQDAMCFW